MNDATVETKPTILVVEDEVPIQHIVRTVLEMHAFHVLTADNGDKALQLSQQHDGPIDLVITDMNLPGISGCDLVRQILVERPKLHVLYISGHFSGETTLARGEEGLMKFLSKPFTPKALLAVVGTMLATPLAG
jgi:DNA-binding response OmpR family regulator